MPEGVVTMGYLLVVNARASVPAVLVENLDDAPAGAFEFYTMGRGERTIGGIILKCPCGCGTATAMPFRRASDEDAWPVWSWDGNEQTPTATPSLLIYQLNEAGQIVGEHWHGFLTAGEWRSC
ncbi:DUF6527 family protein [Sphingomonas aquatica]|uniref:DUF6527 family protein n=2 Tax=Sphingomonas TaxID=13687 RepID=UPI000A9F944C